MSMVIYPAFSRNTISYRLIFRAKVSPVFSKQNKFIVKNKIVNVILNAICSIVWINSRLSVLFSNGDSL